jgi:hypothetical protein
MMLKEKTSKRGSGAIAADYNDAFNMAGWDIDKEKERTLLSDWTLDQFLTFRDQIKVIVQSKVDEIMEVHSNRGFEVRKLQSILKEIMISVNQLTLSDFEQIHLVSNKSYVNARICGTKKDYEFSGECDITTVQGTSLAVNGIEVKNTGKHFITPVEGMLSAEAKMACAQCASQILAHANTLSTRFVVPSFMQIATNGWEWILVIRQLIGVRYVYCHFNPIAICDFNEESKLLTPKNIDNVCFDQVSHMIALMQDTTRFLLKRIESVSITAGLASITLDSDYFNNNQDSGGDRDDNVEEDFDEDPDSVGKPRVVNKNSAQSNGSSTKKQNRSSLHSGEVNDENCNMNTINSISQKKWTISPSGLTLENVMKHTKMLSSVRLWK